jgi:hypothetical protein
MHHCETIVPLHPEIEIKTYHGPWGRMVTDLDLGFSLRNLYNLLFDYFGRQMTYETDTINAFQGVFQLFERRRNIQHFYGLPFLVNHQSSFIKSLLWRAKCTSRQPGFPSWSWAGWRGKNLRFDEALDREDALKKSGIQIWAKPTDRALNRDLELTQHVGFQLPLSSLSPSLNLRAPTAQLKFLSPIDGKLVSSPSQCIPDWYSVAPFMTWVRNGEDDRCYLDIERNQFPTIQVLDAYKSFAVILIGWKGQTSILLVVGKTFSGKNERVGVVFLDPSKYDMLGFSQKVAKKYGLPKAIDLGILDTTPWEVEMVDLE